LFKHRIAEDLRARRITKDRPAGMILFKFLSKLASGYIARRDSWKVETKIVMHENGLIYFAETENLWLPSQADILADDWIIIKLL